MRCKQFPNGSYDAPRSPSSPPTSFDVVKMRCVCTDVAKKSSATHAFARENVAAAPGGSNGYGHRRAITRSRACANEEMGGCCRMFASVGHATTSADCTFAATSTNPASDAAQTGTSAVDGTGSASPKSSNLMLVSSSRANISRQQCPAWMGRNKDGRKTRLRLTLGQASTEGS